MLTFDLKVWYLRFDVSGQGKLGFGSCQALSGSIDVGLRLKSKQERKKERWAHVEANGHLGRRVKVHGRGFSVP